MGKVSIIKKTEAHVRKVMSGESSGHDWWHVYRVWKMARHIGKKEEVDMFVVEIAALLHDIADYKLHGGDEEIGPRTAKTWLESLSVDEKYTNHVYQIIKDINFKGANVSSKMQTIEGMVVQDADRL